MGGNDARFVEVAGKAFLSDYDVTPVPSPAEAPSLRATHTFDIILPDYDLDDGKGTELMPTIYKCQLR